MNKKNRFPWCELSSNQLKLNKNTKIDYLKNEINSIKEINAKSKEHYNFSQTESIWIRTEQFIILKQKKN